MALRPRSRSLLAVRLLFDWLGNDGRLCDKDGMTARSSDHRRACVLGHHVPCVLRDHMVSDGYQVPARLQRPYVPTRGLLAGSACDGFTNGIGYRPLDGIFGSRVLYARSKSTQCHTECKVTLV